MTVSNRFILHQAPVLKALGRTALGALGQRLRPNASQEPPPVPGPELRATLPPRAPELVRAYVRNVGGDPSAYRNHLPPHLFPQWCFPLATQTLNGMPYPMLRVVNGGCRLDIHKPLPADEPLEVTAQLTEIDDNGSRAILHQRVVTSTASAPNALTSTFYAFVPLARSKGPRKPKPRVPLEARELDFWHLPAHAGLDFAKLTGDFNPIHWLPPYARAMGFRSTILHGFATFARAFEATRRQAFKGQRAFTSLDVKFTRPLVLPARVGLYLEDDQLFVGDAPGGPAYMTATFTTQTRS